MRKKYYLASSLFSDTVFFPYTTLPKTRDNIAYMHISYHIRLGNAHRPNDVLQDETIRKKLFLLNTIQKCEQYECYHVDIYIYVKNIRVIKPMYLRFWCLTAPVPYN